MKTALVLEGGAMRGMYTTGVLDIFMEQGIQFDGIIGVSAGALFGVNYLSGQIGRAIRYNKKYNQDKSYMGIRPLIREGNIVSTEYAYERLPRELDVFDDETFKQSNIPFYAVVTNIETGEPEYIQIKSVFDQMDTLRASGSMPFVSKIVEIGQKKYLDGAVTDSIPFEYMLSHGYDRVVVVLTKKVGYIKKPLPARLIKACYKRNYPEFADRLIHRHIMYNHQMEKLFELQKQGIADVIQTKEDIKVSKVEKDPEKLEKLYQIGRSDAIRWIEKLSKSI